MTQVSRYLYLYSLLRGQCLLCAVSSLFECCFVGMPKYCSPSQIASTHLCPHEQRTRTIVTQIGVAHPDGLSDADVSAKLPESVGASVRLGDATVSFTFGNVFLLSCDDDL